jgi:hypothetical protein
MAYGIVLPPQPFDSKTVLLKSVLPQMRTMSSIFVGTHDAVAVNVWPIECGCQWTVRGDLQPRLRERVIDLTGQVLGYSGSAVSLGDAFRAGC